MMTLAAIGCKSPVAPGSGAPTVTILPDNLHGTEFVVYDFKARVENYDQTIIYYVWNLGDDTTNYTRVYNEALAHQFTKPGIYTASVKAFDYYTDSLIASASEQITIDTARSSVEIIPQFYNGILDMTTLGQTTKFALSVKTSLPASQLYQFWDFGDGTTDGYKTGDITHTFPSPGTYFLKVDIYQQNGIYVGEDTALVTINWPAVSLEAIKQTARVEAYLEVDSTFPVDASIVNSFPTSLALLFGGTNITFTGWNGTSFFLDFNDLHYRSLQIFATLSADGKSVDSLGISVNDNGNSYSYSVVHLSLFTVTADRIGFRVSADDLKNDLKNFIFSGNFLGVSREGSLQDSWSTFMMHKSNGMPAMSQCVLVFSKQ